MVYRLLRLASTIALRWYYADVLVQGREAIPAGGPLLVVANHPNAMVDAMLVATTLRHRVRPTAKATLFHNPVLAMLLRVIGVVPLRRAADEAGAVPGARVRDRNAGAFRLVADALIRGDAVLVFPEGISHDAPDLAPFKSGAARMALEARANGARGVRILPLGLVYEAKERPRSRILVRAGEVLALDEWCAAHPNAAAAALTAELEHRLRDVTLNFASDERAETAVATARALAALVDEPGSLGTPRALGTEAGLARRIDAATAALPDADDDLRSDVRAFTQRLDRLEIRLSARGAALAHLRVSPRLRHGMRFVVRESVLLVVTLPVAMLGRVTHFAPLSLARGIALRSVAHDPSRDQPAMRTIVAGLVILLGWYAALWVLVAHWRNPFVATLGVLAVIGAAWLDFLFRDRLSRARARAQTYVALRADRSWAAQALSEADALVAEAVHLEARLLACLPGASGS